MRIRREKCSKCPFRPNGIKLSSESMRCIHYNLVNGTNHMCHSHNQDVVCRGGRDWQLNVFYRLGLISQPNDKALVIMMKKRGIKIRIR